MTPTLSAFERFKERVIGRVDAVRAQCWIWHRWGRWTITGRYKITGGIRGGEVGDGFTQERQCARCGLTQSQSVNRHVYD